MLIALLLLVALGLWYGLHASNYSLGYARCMEDPVRNHGARVSLSLQRVAEVQDGLYTVSTIGPPIPIEGSTPGLEVGDTVSLVGRFDADKLVVIEEWREVHHLRLLKYVMGFVGLVGLGLYLGGTMRWRRRRLVQRA